MPGDDRVYHPATTNPDGSINPGVFAKPGEYTPPAQQYVAPLPYTGDGRVYQPATMNSDGSINPGTFRRPGRPDPEPPQGDGPCGTCGPTVTVKQKTSYGPFYTTRTTPIDGGPPSYGFGFQSTPSFGTSVPQMCTSYGNSPGITSTVSASGFGSSVASRQSFANPFSDSAHSFETCAPAGGATAPSFRPGLSVGIGGIK
jgi:hypothetical protein